MTVLGGGPPGPRRPFLLIGFGRVAGLFILFYFGALLFVWVAPEWRGAGPDGGGLLMAAINGLPALGVLVAWFLGCVAAGLLSAGALRLWLRDRY